MHTRTVARARPFPSPWLATALQAARSGRSSAAGGPGIIPRAIKELFREAKAQQDAQGAAMQVCVRARVCACARGGAWVLGPRPWAQG